MRFFECWFFHQIAPPGPIRGTLGRFRFLLTIHLDIRQKVGLAVYYTQGNGDSLVHHPPQDGNSAVYLTLWNCTNKVFKNSALLRWRLRCVSYTAEPTFC